MARKREMTIGVMLTEEEYGAVQAAARDAERSMGGLIRRIVLKAINSGSLKEPEED